MKFDITDIGVAVFIGCMGFAVLSSQQSKDRRAEACEARGGHMVTIKENWIGDEKTCSLNVERRAAAAPPERKGTP